MQARPFEGDGPGSFLVGRDAELCLLGFMVEELKKGRSGLLTVTGAAGAGRSTLLRAAVALARRAGVATGLVRCSPLETEIPFSTVSQLVAVLGPPEQLPVLSLAMCEQPGEDCADPESSISLPYEAFSAIVRDAPLLLAVDDGQWADPWSHRWLQAMARRADHLPVLLIRAVRDGALPGPMREAPGWGLLDEAYPVAPRELRLGPLGAEEVSALLDAEGPGAVAPEFAAAAVRATGGNPAVLRAALGRFAAAGLPFGADEVPELLRRAEQAVVARTGRILRGLPPEAVELLRVLTLCGPEFDFDLVRAVAGLPRPAADAAMDLLVRLDLAEGGESPRCAGAAVAAGVRAELDAAERERLCTRAAELGHLGGVGSSALAELLLETPPVGEDWAVRVLTEAAGRHADAQRYERAAALVRRALAEPVTSTEQQRLRVDLAAVEVGHAPAASDSRLRQVLAEPGAGTPRLLVRAADLLVCRGDTDAARLAIAEVCANEDASEETATLSALGWLADEECATEPDIPLSPLPPLPAEPAGPAQAGALAWSLVLEGTRPDRARRFARVALAVRDDDAPLGPRIAASGALIFTGDVAEGIAGRDAVIFDARRRGARAAAAQTLVHRAAVIMRAGRWDEAAADLAAAAAELPLSSWHPAMLPRYLMIEILLNLHRGRIELAEEVADAELPLGAERGIAWGFLLYAKGELRLATGDAAAALRLFQECGRILRAKRWLNPAVQPWRIKAAVAHARLGDLAAARRMAGAELELARRWDVPGVFAGLHQPVLAALAEAGVELDPDDVLPERSGTLSEPEQQVAALAVRGLSNRDIADRLSVAVRTVELRLTKVYRKLGVEGRAELPAGLASQGWQG
ncbi:helix-turn-helix transcriptional regulator [Amycolatopsis nigrescens]|uniref:helix-turn-helix transcriptional regulator n=1 Tax=Amycolatopsis nigrescens TaxID=381445 RepID=UPI00037CEF06|nr:LuxR family transcriptional regulator [Amycolatopsis nigrescens]